MNLFWRETPLSEWEESLVRAVLDAHYKSCFRPNPSSIAIQCGARGNGDLCHSLAAALSTLGKHHGPVSETCAILRNPKPATELVKEIIELGQKVPGWGSSFTNNGESDPLWDGVIAILKDKFTREFARLNEITDALHTFGKLIVPNPSAYTAITAIIIGMPDRIAPLLLVAGRIEAWAEIFTIETKEN